MNFFARLEQLGIIEGLFFAPLEKHDVTVKLRDTPRVRFNVLNYSFQPCERGWFLGTDFYAISILKS